jgi:hypothetical protein
VALSAELRGEDFRWADLAQNLKEREEELVSAVIIAQSADLKWSELLTSAVFAELDRKHGRLREIVLVM